MSGCVEHNISQGAPVYYPYLYARKEELLALRAVASELTKWDVVPILEPANPDPAGLVRCLETLKDHGATCYVILNPSKYALQSPDPAWSAAIAPYVAPNGPVLPMHQIKTVQSAPELQGFLNTYGSGQTAVSIRAAHISPQALKTSLNGRNTIAFLHEGASHNAYLQALPASQAVHVGHRFNVKARNADYNGDEWFTDAHRTYLSEHRPGYSDFGPVATDFKLSGGEASAAAIHLTYLASDGDIWVEHFVSDNVTRGVGNATSKLGEATAKVAKRVANDPPKFVSSLGLRMFLDQDARQSPTNLGQSKRQQIMHHLHTTAIARPAVATTSPVGTP